MSSYWLLHVPPGMQHPGKNHPLVSSDIVNKTDFERDTIKVVSKKLVNLYNSEKLYKLTSFLHPSVTQESRSKKPALTKFLNKWLRKIHRWIAVPTALLIPVRLMIEAAENASMIEFWAKWEKLPSLLMLFMAVTGAYLYLLPYIVKAQRKKKFVATPNEMKGELE